MVTLFLILACLSPIIISIWDDWRKHKEISVDVSPNDYKGFDRFKPDGITDNRMEWAERVLREKVPEPDVQLALMIMIENGWWHIPDVKKCDFNYNRILPHIQPRLIAGNWNKNTGE